MGYHEYVLGAVVQYIYPIHIGRHSIHIPNTCHGCPIHMYKCSPRHIRTPIYMKICIGYMCWIASIYIGSHNICIGYISWITLHMYWVYVLDNTLYVLGIHLGKHRICTEYISWITLYVYWVYVLGNNKYVLDIYLR